MGGPPELDVLKAFSSAKFSVSTPESPADQKHRHFIEKFWTIVVAVVIGAILVIGCFMVFRSSSVDVQKGGMALLGAALTGVLGILAGRGSK